MVFLVFAVCFLMTIMVGLLSVAKLSGILGYPYARRSSLLEPSEHRFWLALDQAVGTNFRIQAKVRVSDVLMIRSEAAGLLQMGTFGWISEACFDFVLVDTKTFAPVAVILLEGTSARKRQRRVREEQLAVACVSAQLPLLRVPDIETYDVPALRRQVLHTLFPPVIAGETPEVSPVFCVAK